jgi:hypothetical protein
VRFEQERELLDGRVVWRTARVHPEKRITLEAGLRATRLDRRREASVPRP